ncbi:hypothetical protein GGI15_002160 [Coemansia interrupta]|uniref:Uncharacterized protein n=1 Tax=Coemansia interrupta TaxID=1126814 RepID=A0A9W8LM34_9FUNG|nr:hypothetical protein GGI15_002160 [Coemansia interrupta]
MRGDTVGGYTVAFLFLLATLANILPLVYLVERSRLCVDFTATYVVVHLVLVVWIDGLPLGFLWWVTVAVAAAGMALGGRAACARREMLPIRIRRYLPERPVDDAAEEEVELQDRAPGVLFETPGDIAADIDAEESRAETRPEPPLPPKPTTAANTKRDNANHDNGNDNDDDDDGWNDNWGEEEAEEEVHNAHPRPPASKGAKHD